jgi:hypothetical protein
MFNSGSFTALNFIYLKAGSSLDALFAFLADSKLPVFLKNPFDDVNGIFDCCV